MNVAVAVVGLLASACGDGGGGAVEISIGATEQQPYPFTFEAEGVAVDEGVVCSSGDVEEGSQRSGAITMTFTCGDGSGLFILETAIDLRGFEGEGVPDSDWTFLSGTGDYDGLDGSGIHRWFKPDEISPPEAMDVVLQVMEGTISR